MGADLITVVAVWPQNTSLDFDAGREVIAMLTDEDVPEHVLDGAIGYDLDYDDEGKLTAKGIKELRESLAGAVDTVQHLIGGARNTATYSLFNHNVLILGEMSWGDAPEGYDELVAPLEVEPLAKAIGFSLDIYT